MNISSEIFSPELNSSVDPFLEEYSDVSLVVNIICILISFPLNSYVIWLIVAGTGNGLAAEFFNLHLSVCEILLCLEILLTPLNSKSDISIIALKFLDGVLCVGRSLFESLICVERYLAVVHPVIFLKFKPLRYRLICSAVACVTTVISGVSAVMDFLLCFDLYLLIWLGLFVVFLSVQLFCCVAVLRVLKKSGPGERGREREEENHMKKRAFYLILITTVFSGVMNSTLFILMSLPTSTHLLDLIKLCIGEMCFILVGLVQPVLFLYRVGKLNFMKCQ